MDKSKRTQQHRDKADQIGLDNTISELVRHLAFISAEHDYFFFRRTGAIPYTGEDPERKSP